jgi:Mlc titration factor MtfA (ptsG expression regulator)
MDETRQEHSDINPFGATNEAKFFNVVGKDFSSEHGRLTAEP